MKKNFIFIAMLSLVSFKCFSFDSDKYVLDELKRISTRNEIKFYYDYGDFYSDAEKKKMLSEGLTPIKAIFSDCWYSYLEYKKDNFKSVSVPRPRNISEAKQLASYFWAMYEYIYVRKDLVIKGNKY